MRNVYVICDNIRSLENIGSIFRTADAIGVAKIFLCGISGTPPHHKITKTALGAETTVPFEYCRHVWRLVEKLQREHVRIVALEQTRQSIPLSNYVPGFPVALVVGNEVKGVSKSVLKRADIVIAIPMKGRKESLNVAVAFGIAGYYITQVV